MTHDKKQFYEAYLLHITLLQWSKEVAEVFRVGHVQTIRYQF